MIQKLKSKAIQLSESLSKYLMVLGNVAPSLLAWLLQCCCIICSIYFMISALLSSQSHWYSSLLLIGLASLSMLVALLSGEFIRRELKGGES